MDEIARVRDESGQLLIDSFAEFCHSARMSSSLKKLIALLLAIWLPLMTGNSLAASIAMQAQQGSCHEAEMEGMSAEEHHHANADTHQTVADQSANESSDTQDVPCNNCGICHLACSGYLAVTDIQVLSFPQTGDSSAPYLVSFQSLTTLPLLPPPLARM